MAFKWHYGTLSIPRDAAPLQIKTAYRSLALTSHPDQRGTRELFEAVTDAYKVLSNPKLRADYDRSLDKKLSDTGWVLCPSCGLQIEVPPMLPDQQCRCVRCDSILPITEPERREKETSALSRQATQVAVEIAGEIIETAGDFVVGKVREIKTRFGVKPRRKS